MNPAPPDPNCILRENTRSPITSVCFQFHEGFLLSGNQNGHINTWNLKTQRVVKSVEAHNNESVIGLHVLNHEQIISHGRDGCIHIWQVSGTDWEIKESYISRSAGFCSCITIKVDGEIHLVLPTDSSNLELVSLSDKRQISSSGEIKSESNHGMCMGLSRRDDDQSNSTHIFAGYEDGNIACWNVKTRNISSCLECFKESTMALDYQSGMNKGVCASVDQNIVIWKLNPDDVLISLQSITITNPGFSCVKFRTDGKLFVLGGWDSQGRMFSAKKYKPLAILSYHSQTIQCVSFSEENTLAMGSKDGAISLWNLYK